MLAFLIYLISSKSHGLEQGLAPTRIIHNQLELGSSFLLDYGEEGKMNHFIENLINMFVIVLGIERVLVDLELKNLEEARVFQDRDLSKITDGFSTPGSVAQVGEFFGNS